MSSLAIAYAVKKKNQKGTSSSSFVKGEEVEEKKSLLAPKSIVKGIMAKKMAKGGEVEVQDDDLFSLDEPEVDLSDLETPAEDPAMRRKKLLADILSK